MKRLSFIFVFLLVGVWSFAQREPKELTFSNTVIIPDKSKDEIKKKADKWILDNRGDTPLNSPFYHTDFLGYDRCLHYCIDDCPNFGLPRWAPGGENGTIIDFVVAIDSREHSYTVKLFHISSTNPNVSTVYYGENGELYPELYNKKQIKNSIPIIDYVSDFADNLFLEIKDYMTKD